MKVHKILWLCCLAALLGGCEPIGNGGGGETPYLPEESYGDEIGTFFVESRNMTLKLLDITEFYEEVAYMNLPVPVNHTHFESLPEGLKETVKSYGLSFQTQVYRMKWHGETVYHLINLMMEDINGVFKPSGERIRFSSFEAYLQFLQEISDVNCVLLMEVEVVRSVDGAPKLLAGTWQTDWRHLHHDIGATSGIDEEITLYENLPFSMTEVCYFNTDGTGYLRSIKTFKNGSQEVALDPFTYQTIDYHPYASGTNTNHAYVYVCYYAAGDTIEYNARSLDDFNHVFDRAYTFVTYPWYKQHNDSFSSKKGDPKYGTPEKEKKSPIVGRWSGYGKSAARSFGIHPYTWVFRNDGTGYLLMGRQITQEFAYTVDGKNGSELQLTLYKYDTGFYADDGFWKDGDWTYQFARQPLPKGNPMKAKVYDDGNSLELEGWTNRAADFSTSPIVFQRVSR